MIDVDRFRKMRTLQDIKLEKARLSYEMLLAEKALTEDIQAVYDGFSYLSIFSRIADGYAFVQKMFSKFSWIYHRFIRRDQEETES